METDISELEINDELRGMLSGNFETSEADVVERQENIDLPQLPQLLVEEEVRELPEHRFGVKEDSEKITLFIGDYIFRRRYVRGDSAT